LKRGNAFGFVSHKRLLLISVPQPSDLWETVYNLARMLASDRRLTLGWRFDAVEEVRSGPSQATRHIAVAGTLKILQPLPARDVSNPPATLLKTVPLRIVCARAYPKTRGSIPA
jgi:hypothetical protein